MPGYAIKRSDTKYLGSIPRTSDAVFINSDVGIWDWYAAVARAHIYGDPDLAAAILWAIQDAVTNRAAYNTASTSFAIHDDVDADVYGICKLNTMTGAHGDFLVTDPTTAVTTWNASDTNIGADQPS